MSQFSKRMSRGWRRPVGLIYSGLAAGALFFLTVVGIASGSLWIVLVCVTVFFVIVWVNGK